MRGKPTQRRTRSRTDGTIPACAGETVLSDIKLFLTRDHPRVCGGNSCKLFELFTVTGPSPRVRGKLHSLALLIPPLGTIPACAGETHRPCIPSTWHRDHPRVCGGNENLDFARSLRSGPSPRVRGKRSFIPFVTLVIRTIPACAGETDSVSTRFKSNRDHPRVCGGNFKPEFLELHMRGPSPRVRGKP